MKLCKADVSTVCLGLAASMGAFLLAAGTKGKRFCMPNAKVMIHQPMGSAGGKVSYCPLRLSLFLWKLLTREKWWFFVCLMILATTTKPYSTR